MKEKTIVLIRKNPFLFRIAKKVHQLYKPQKSELIIDQKIYLSYIMKEEKDLKKIKNHYTDLELNSTQLLVFVEENLNLELHSFFEENPTISFLSVDYMKKYQRQAPFINIFLLDFNSKYDIEKIIKSFTGGDKL